MDCCVRVFYGGIVRKEDGMFEGMDEEVEWFDKPPSFDDLCGRLHDKFGGDSDDPDNYRLPVSKTFRFIV
jgi:hypothetical protein